VRLALSIAALAVVLGVASSVGTAGAERLRSARTVRADSGAGGAIEGTVTNAVTKSPIAGIEVCAYPLEPEAAEPTCGLTGAVGTYALAVGAGEYVVAFFSPFGSGLNYVTVFQNGDTSWEEAELEPVVVAAGGTDAGVNAAMHEGGRIEGHVASADDPGVGVEGIEVCALGEEGFACVVTGAGGDYEISALRAGKYLVFFEPPVGSELDYLTQFYERVASPTEARLVGVAAGKTTANIDALLERGGEIAGKLTAAPSGEPLEGAEACALTSETHFVSCVYTNSKGEYVLRRLEPGTYVIGFEAPGFQWQYYPSGQTWSLAQRVLVGAGTGVGLVTTELLPIGYVPPPPVEPVPPPAAPPAPTTPPAAPAGAGVAGVSVHVPAITVSSTRLPASHGHLSVKLSCTGAACNGSLRVTIRVAYRIRRHGHTVTLHRTVVLAQGTYSLAADSAATIALRETAAGHARLAHASRTPVIAQLLGSVTGGAGLTVSVHVS
jgi:hypothetical protein